MCFCCLLLSAAPSPVPSPEVLPELTHLRRLRGCGHEAVGAEICPGGGAEVRHFGSRRLKFGFDLLTADNRRSEGQEAPDLLFYLNAFQKLNSLTVCHLWSTSHVL